MSILSRVLLMAAGGADVPAPDVRDVFDASLWNGSGSPRSVFTGTDLNNEGGLALIKSRNTFRVPKWVDTVRGGPATGFLSLTTLGSNQEQSDTGGVTGFSSSGFSLGNDGGGGQAYNSTGETYLGLTFRKSMKFFNVIAFTGNGLSGRKVSHGLGVEPGMIIVKRRDAAGDWMVYHRGAAAQPSAGYLKLNSSNAWTPDNSIWGGVEPTKREFTLGSDPSVNAPSGEYIAYVFAHDPSGSGAIQCGNLVGAGSGFSVANLGWRPQFLLWKKADASGNWNIVDTRRGWTDTGNFQNLTVNTAMNESSSNNGDITKSDTGFAMSSGATGANNIIYMAIRAEGV